MNPFDFSSPATLSEALALLAPEARPIAGGTDLLGLMKNGVLEPAMLVNLQTVGGLGDIREDESGLQIGAGARIADVLAWPGLWQAYPLLAQACQYVAWPEIRTMGTVGGNLCQRPRCWYFRHPLGIRCLKRGGDTCYPVAGRADGPFAIFGGGPCYAVYPSDLAPALVAMDATVTIATRGQETSSLQRHGASGAEPHDREQEASSLQRRDGERTISLADFFTGEDIKRENVLQPQELLIALHVPRPPAGTRAVFLKSKRRPSHDFSGVSVALSARLEDGICSAPRLVLGSVALRPWRLPEVERLLDGQRLSGTLIEEAGRLAVRDARPLISSLGHSNAVKIRLTGSLVRKACRRLIAG